MKFAGKKVSLMQFCGFIDKIYGIDEKSRLAITSNKDTPKVELP